MAARSRRCRVALASIAYGCLIVVMTDYVSMASEPDAPTEASARGCLAPQTPDALEYITVHFEGGMVAHNAVVFFEYLRKAEVLPCQLITLGAEDATIAHALVRRRILPTEYPASMTSLICRLNPQKCRGNTLKHYQRTDSFIVPAVEFELYPFTAQLPLEPKDDPAKNLAGILRRNHVVVLSGSKRDVAKRLEDIKRANLYFERPLTRAIDLETGEAAKENILLVPGSIGFRARLDLPRQFLTAHLDSALGIPPGNFFTERDSPSAPAIRSGASDSIDPTQGDLAERFADLAKRFAEATRFISLPSSLPPARHDVSVVIVDRGIHAENVFLQPIETDAQPPTDTPLLTAASCTPKEQHHGTHVWGIIAGSVPHLMTGLDPDASVSSWDFDKHAPNDPEDLPVFLNSTAQWANVVNMSLDFENTLGQTQMGRLGVLVNSKRHFLFVVPAADTYVSYKATSQLPLPIALWRSENVLVVTALDILGTGIMDGVGQNDSATDSVVHLAAPGVDIPSTCGSNAVGVLSGTSQATAFVSGAAALLVRGGVTDPWKIKIRLQYTADVLPQLVKPLAAGRLDVSRSLDADVDKLCPLTNGTGLSCSPWTRGTAQFGYVDPTTRRFIRTESVVLQTSLGEPIQVPSSRVMRIVSMGNNGMFSAFYLEPDEVLPYRLRRKPALTNVFSLTSSGLQRSLVIRLRPIDGGPPKDVPLALVADFARRVTDVAVPDVASN